MLLSIITRSCGVHTAVGVAYDSTDHAEYLRQWREITKLLRSNPKLMADLERLESKLSNENVSMTKGIVRPKNKYLLVAKVTLNLQRSRQ